MGKQVLPFTFCPAGQCQDTSGHLGQAGSSKESPGACSATFAAPDSQAGCSCQKEGDSSHGSSWSSQPCSQAHAKPSLPGLSILPPPPCPAGTANRSTSQNPVGQPPPARGQEEDKAKAEMSRWAHEMGKGINLAAANTKAGGCTERATRAVSMPYRPAHASALAVTDCAGSGAHEEEPGYPSRGNAAKRGRAPLSRSAGCWAPEGLAHAPPGKLKWHHAPIRAACRSL